MSDHTMAAIAADKLPASLRQIVAIIGLEKTLRIVDAVGGTELYIPTPERIDADHSLAALVGLEAATKLAEHYRSDMVHIAKAAVAIRALRNAGIIADHKAGLSKRDLARRYRLDVRQIRTILKTSNRR